MNFYKNNGYDCFYDEGNFWWFVMSVTFTNLGDDKNNTNDVEDIVEKRRIDEENRLLELEKLGIDKFYEKYFKIKREIGDNFRNTLFNNYYWLVIGEERL